MTKFGYDDTKWRFVHPDDRDALRDAAIALGAVCKRNGLLVEVDGEHFGIFPIDPALRYRQQADYNIALLDEWKKRDL